VGVETVSSLQGSTFVVCDHAGDVDASPSEPQGLFFQDTRFLSRWRLTVDGQLVPFFYRVRRIASLYQYQHP